MYMARCDKCNKKLGIHEYKCKCNKIFCITHLHAEDHNCTFDYKAEGHLLLKAHLEVGPLKDKIEKI